MNYKEYSLPEMCRGEKSKLIMTGRHSYGVDSITTWSWDEGAHLVIGGFCSLASPLTIFLGGNHRTDWTTTYPFGHIKEEIFPSGEVNGGGHPASKGHVIIGNDVWIGKGCTIMSGVTIGSGSVIATQSVVVKDVEPYSVVGGNPAKTLKYRFPQHIINELLEIKWWDRSDEEIDKIVPLLQQSPTDETILKIKELLTDKN